MTDPAIDAVRFCEELVDRARSHDYSLVLPGSDRVVLALSDCRDSLEPLLPVGLPASEIVERALDRGVLAEASAIAGFAAIPSARCEDADEALGAVRDIGLPVIVKSEQTARRIGSTVQQPPPSRLVASERSLASSLASHFPPFIVQQPQHGQLMSFCAVRAADHLLGQTLVRYVRTWPPDAGDASFAETVEVPRDLDHMVAELVGAIGWQGMFQLELIRSPGGRYVALDFNPRPYGSLGLAIAAGASLPSIWCDWVLGRDPDGAAARPGVRYRWEDGDIRHIAWQVRHGDIGAAARSAIPRRRVAHAHLSAHDPLPLLLRGALFLSQRWNGQRRRSGDISAAPVDVQPLEHAPPPSHVPDS